MLYPLGDDVDLSFLEGRELIQVSIGIYQVSFSKELTITVEDCFVIDEPKGQTTWKPEAIHEASRTVCLLGRTTKEVRRSGSALELQFGDGYSLAIRPVESRFESYQINDGRRLFIV
jgi:hypothetical protein